MVGVSEYLPGYTARDEELAALRMLLYGRVAGVRALFLEGVPGCGKTFLGECLAKGQQCPLVFYQCHSWTSDQELFEGINVTAAVAGDSDSVRRDGCLTAAVKHSLSGKVVLLIDELDKAPERVDALLLDFLQSARVPYAGGTLVGNKDNLLVFITSNAVREPHPALVRRCRRLKMTELDKNVFDNLLVSNTQVSLAVARQVRRICRIVAAEDVQTASLQEAINFCEELKFVKSTAEVAMAAKGWAVRGSKGENYLASEKGQTMLAELAHIVGVL